MSSLEPQSLVVLMKLVVCTRSSLEPQSFSANMAPRGASAVSMFPCVRGRTAEDALGFVDLSHVDSQLCVADQGAVTGS